MEKDMNLNTAKTTETRKNFELLEKGLDIIKVILTNNISAVKFVCDTVKDVGKSVENSMNINSEKEMAAAEKRMQFTAETREIIIDELHKEWLSKEDYHKLLDLLDKNTPKEEAIQAITRGTSVAKTMFCVIGAVAVTLIATKRKK